MLDEPPPPPLNLTPTATTNTSHPFPLPKILTYPSATTPELITQGAEGRLYKTTYLVPDLPCALKYRPPKPWRHPALDARLTRHRILAEARILAKCRREGVGVPAVYAADEGSGWLMMEWVEGGPVRVGINRWLAEHQRQRRRRRERGRERERRRGEGVVDSDNNNGEEEEKKEKEDDDDEAAGVVTGEAHGDAALVHLLRRVGEAVGRLHRVGIVHGDLTTSNMMLRPWTTSTSTSAPPPLNGHHHHDEEEAEEEASKMLDGDVVIIDFGLASQSQSDEDRAVDLYVLERAFASTHPRAQALFVSVLESSYRGAFRQAPVVLKKLEEVRMRGRKRSMLG
ncbi:protein kinase [Xylariomycetidae sp. FL2044]|nr:protein kinase [Xylariomycetidae sp. FL2044]